MKLVQCGPGLRYSVNLRIQTYTEPVPLKYGKLGYFYSACSCVTSLDKLTLPCRACPSHLSIVR